MKPGLVAGHSYDVYREGAMLRSVTHAAKPDMTAVLSFVCSSNVATIQQCQAVLAHS